MKKITIGIFIDALGFEVCQKYNFLNNQRLYSQKLESIFGFSSACDPSILTGKYPEEHTHWSSFFYSPQTSPFKVMKILSSLPKSIFDRWKVRHLMSKLIGKYYGFTGYFQLYHMPFKYLPYFDYLEKKDYFVPGGILKTETIFDKLFQDKIPYFASNWRLAEQENINIARNIIKSKEPRFLYLYLPLLDGIMHQYGTNHLEVARKLAKLEQTIISLVELAKSYYQEVDYYVFGDHGMCNVTKEIDLMKEIEALKYIYGKDYVAIYDSTMVRFYFFNKQVKQDIIDLLNEKSYGYIVSKEELKAMKVFFVNEQFGELFFLMHSGNLIVPSYFGLKKITGMHGYHPFAKDSYTILLSNQKLSRFSKSITNIRSELEKSIYE